MKNNINKKNRSKRRYKSKRKMKKGGDIYQDRYNSYEYNRFERQRQEEEKKKRFEDEYKRQQYLRDKEMEKRKLEEKEKETEKRDIMYELNSKILKILCNDKFNKQNKSSLKSDENKNKCVEFLLEYHKYRFKKNYINDEILNSLSSPLGNMDEINKNKELLEIHKDLLFLLKNRTHKFILDKLPSYYLKLVIMNILLDNKLLKNSIYKFFVFN